MELLIRTAPKGDREPGHVISICPDGWGWSAAERANPEWRIVRVPLLPVEADALLMPGPEGQFRAARIDLAGMAGDEMTAADLYARLR